MYGDLFPHLFAAAIPADVRFGSLAGLHTREAKAERQNIRRLLRHSRDLIEQLSKRQSTRFD
jgi:hypothetical protein